MTGEDLEGVKQLKARYLRYLDTKDWTGLRTVFADDARVDVSEDGFGVHEDIEAYLEQVRAGMSDSVSVHHAHMPEVRFTSPTTATGTWAMEDHIWFAEGAPLKHLHGYGHYHERYEKGTDGSWRISELRLSRLRRDLVT